MPRVRSFLLFVAVCVFCACQYSHDDRDREDCDRLVDHLVDVQLGDGEDTAHAAEREKHRRILHDAIHDRVVAECLAGAAARTDCALRAATSAELKECD